MASGLRREDDLGRLVPRLRRHDEEAWEEFVGAFNGKAIRYFRARGFGLHTAEDLAQETFAAAYGGLNGLRDGTSLMAWLYTIMRRTGARQRSEQATGEILMDPRMIPSPRVARTDGAPELLAHPLWNSLRPQDRELLLLRYVNGLSAAEIAVVIGSGAVPVRMRLWRLRRQLRSGQSPQTAPETDE